MESDIQNQTLNPNKKKVLGTLLLFVAIALLFLFFKGVGTESILSQKDTELSQEGKKELESTLYISSDGSFQFNHEKGFTSSNMVETDESTGETKEIIMFRGKGEKDNIQIVVTSFDSDPISIARIRREVPSLIMEDARDISINGAPGSTFVSIDTESKMKTREVWFSRYGVLYQISTYTEFDESISKILETWKWNE